MLLTLCVRAELADAWRGQCLNGAGSSASYTLCLDGGLRVDVQALVWG